MAEPGPAPARLPPRSALFDPVLLDHVEEQRAHNAKLMEVTAAMAAIDTASPTGLQWVRAAMEPGGAFGMTSLDFPEVRTIPGPTGPLPVRVLTPDRVDGVYLHLHGGGMTVGSARSMDHRNWPLAQACNVAVISVDYRLAPEHPYPAGPDDCAAAARWLLEHCVAEFGTDNLVIGGESAGAYLALLTLIRLRDHRATVPPFRGADLCYGSYDMGGTPSRVQLAGKVPYATGTDANRDHYLPGRTLEQLRDPALSPLWADLHDLPPTLLTIGTADWLLDDNLFLAARLASAGNDVRLAVYPEGPHGIDGAPTTMGEIARTCIYEFIAAVLRPGHVA
ncbi:MAG TPA: alpha/beta hydrolase [Acidimicrobiales bacterium]|jgi:acetyl esterase/lipase|nr:alpha/beta hydrolase [Acidimicrobiales bacterium]